MSGELALRELRVEFGDGVAPVDDVSLTVPRGRCLCLLGESGCGKSLTALALMRLLPDGARVAHGSALLDGVDLFGLPESEMQAVRGGRLAMVFQEPMTSLNPVTTLASQVGEALRAHGRGTGAGRVAELLEEVGLPANRAGAYPFQLSGGQRQRALIAMMLAADPDYLIADEPTTALDVVVQAQILELLRRLQRERGMGLLLVTHDIGVARMMADTVAVAYAGQVVESGPAGPMLERPRHPYARALLRVQHGLRERGGRLAAIPGAVVAPGSRAVGCRFAARCDRARPDCETRAPAVTIDGAGSFRCHHPVLVGGVEERAAVAVPAVRVADASVLEANGLVVRYPVRTGLLRRTVGHFTAVDRVSLSLAQGETLAIVGESGCGKTTLARTLMQLQAQDAGDVLLDGARVERSSASELRRLRRAVQVVFQDPYSSLDPRRTIAEILEEGMLSLRPDLGPGDRRRRIAELVAKVGLDERALARYPHAFSGGQRQRVAIARALSVEPRVLILDEPTSALDISVQAQILNLLRELQRERGLSYLLISHNLPVVGWLADRVAVMKGGAFVEEGAADDVMRAPRHPYTRELLAASVGLGADTRAY